MAVIAPPPARLRLVTRAPIVAELRPIAPLAEAGKLQRNPVAPPPKIAWLPLECLVVDAEYQRDPSQASRRLIRKLVAGWDWNRFKPLSVAAVGGGRYEVVDGQHTAIAAATHGSIETLPCLVLDAATLAARAQAFVGINVDRVGLTPYALWRARVAADDPEACAVDGAIRATGVNLVESLQRNAQIEPPRGTLACVGTLLQIVRRGGQPRLARLLRIALRGGVNPIPSGLIKGLELIVTGPRQPSDADLVAAVAAQPIEDLVAAAGERRRAGVRGAEAWSVVVLAALPRRAAA